MTPTLELLAFGGLCVGLGMICAYAYERGKGAYHELEKRLANQKDSIRDLLEDRAALQIENDKLLSELRFQSQVVAPSPIDLSACLGPRKPTPKKHKKAGPK